MVHREMPPSPTPTSLLAQRARSAASFYDRLGQNGSACILRCLCASSGFRQ